MSNSILFLISFVIFISSLSESFEFIVHNEESLLVLCFIAFIFFAYSFGSVEASDYIKKTAASLEDQLLLVVFSRFKALISNFNEFFFFRGLVIRFQFILALLLSRLRSDWSTSLFELNSLINSLFLLKLNNVLRLKSQVLKPIQDKLNSISLMPLLFTSSFSSLVFDLNLKCFIKKSNVLESSLFFHKSVFLKQVFK